jgi:hypothetical protein
MYAHLTLACLLAALNIQFELRYEEVERARAVFERYVEVSTALPAIEHGCSCGRTTQSPLLYTLTQVSCHRSTHTLSLSPRPGSPISPGHPLQVLPSVKAWVRYAKFELSHNNVAGARSCYERAMEALGEDANTVRGGAAA